MIRDEEIVTTQSLRQACRALEEIAVQGGWTAGDRGEWSVIYEHEGQRLYISKKAERQWQVMKSQRPKT